jgi:hypothetical protein
MLIGTYLEATYPTKTCREVFCGIGISKCSAKIKKQNAK